MQEAESLIVGSATLTNAGSVNILASASATAFDFAEASAEIGVGVEQEGSALGSISTGALGLTSLTNSGNLTVWANGVAFSTDDDAFAGAAIEAGVVQEAEAGGTSSSALTILTNSGNLTVGAHAVATATDDATAEAIVGLGVVQEAIDGGTGTSLAASTLTNSGTLLISSSASATGDDFDADALAEVVIGVGQFSLDDGGTAANTLTNAWNATLQVQAVADAHNFDENAAGEAAVLVGVGQVALDGLNNVNTLTNAGAINVMANAEALATNTANAIGEVFIGVGQLAVGDGVTGGSSIDILTNTGAITIGVNVLADPVDVVHAFAGLGVCHSGTIVTNWSGYRELCDRVGCLTAGSVSPQSVDIGSVDGLVGAGIGQIADPSTNVATLFTNSGTIQMFAVASAKASITATATADVHVGVAQVASATGSTGTGLASVVNTGTLTVLAAANAIAGDSADAFANVGGIFTSSGAGIDQFVFAVQTATASVINAGVLMFEATATATSPLGEAEADAEVVGIAQHAFAGSGTTASKVEGAALANFTNVGLFQVLGDAVAVGSSGAEAGA